MTVRTVRIPLLPVGSLAGSSPAAVSTIFVERYARKDEVWACREMSRKTKRATASKFLQRHSETHPNLMVGRDGGQKFRGQPEGKALKATRIQPFESLGCG